MTKHERVAFDRLDAAAETFVDCLERPPNEITAVLREGGDVTLDRHGPNRVLRLAREFAGEPDPLAAAKDSVARGLGINPDRLEARWVSESHNEILVFVD
jgi:hypothetical protein